MSHSLSRRALLASVGCCLVSTAVHARGRASLSGHDVIVVMGQSNALGAGLGPAAYSDPDMPARLLQAYEPTPGDLIIGPCTGRLEASYGAPEGRPTGIGPSESMLRRFAAAGALDSGRGMVVVNGSIGGSSILQWGATADERFGAAGNLYLRTVSRTRRVLRDLPGTNRIVGLVIQNAETEIFWRVFSPGDFRALAPANFGRHLYSLIARFRSDLGADIPVSIGEPVETWMAAEPERWSIVAEIRATPRRLARCRMATCDGLRSNKDIGASPTDDVHYSAQAAITLGRRHADNIMTIGRY